MLKDLFNAVFFNFFNILIFVNADSHNVTFLSDDVALVNVNLNNVSLDDDKFDHGNPEIYARIVAWCNRYKQRKTCKKEIPK